MVSARSFCLALTSAALLALGACGGAESGLDPTLGESLPEVEQDGSMVKEFIAICGDIVIDEMAPASALEGFDWEQPVGATMAQMAAIGGFAAEKSEAALSLQVMPVDFPHLQGVNCTISTMDPMTVDMASLDPFESLEGFDGGVRMVGAGRDRTELGRYSGVARDGAVVTINAMRFEDGRFMTLSMSKSKPVDPAGSEDRP
ncbi:MAG: hypothetical protein WA989_08800 [Henriciella sp.]|uniref:hypothetical protein n=1 Tax=Henriciella sp. TaxID=1968823 RepID=UPI003C76AA51